MLTFFQQPPTIPTDNIPNVLGWIIGVLIVVIAYIYKSYENKIDKREEIIRAITKDHLLDIKDSREADNKLASDTLVALEKQMDMMRQIKEILRERN